MSILKKIQEQPVYIRKIIFWVIVSLLTIAFLFFLIESIKVRVGQAGQKNFFNESNFPEFEEDLNNLPKIGPPPEIPELSEEEQKQLEEELLKELQEQNNSTPEFPQPK